MNIVPKTFILIILICLLNLQCSSTDPATGEKVIINPDPKKKAEEFVKKDGGLFGDITKGKNNTTYEFATSNILWRATLKTLEFMPVMNADYSGGVIVYDWYSEKEDSNDQLKVTIRFLSNELRSDSLQVITHKKTCSTNERCKISKLSDSFNSEIKNSIISSARAMKIEEQKDKK
jgi:hypothetical protein